jgi:hypothetical protein
LLRVRNIESETEIDTSSERDDARIVCMDSGRKDKVKVTMDEGQQGSGWSGDPRQGFASQRAENAKWARQRRSVGNSYLPVAMKTLCTLLLLLWFGLFALAPGCERTPSGASALAVSKLTPANYAKITTGMTKAQVERIMGSPTTMETKDMVIFKKTTYRYEEGSKFAVFTFKNDELDSKDGNLTAP